LDDIQAIEQAVWNEDFAQLVQNLGAELRHDPHQVSFHVAYADGRPASCAWIRYHRGSQFASLWGGSTLPEYRKRGLYTALVAVRLQAALERGVRYLAVDASPMSAPILQRYGFRQITTCTPFKWKAK
jgi:GNAT superfamily N-acetyltransferase